MINPKIALDVIQSIFTKKEEPLQQFKTYMNKNEGKNENLSFVEEDLVLLVH